MYKPTNTGPATGKGLHFGSGNLLHPDWDVIELAEWVAPMQECPQEPEFHAEGDVWTHTRMVVDALLNLPEFRTLEPPEQSLLIHAALLHDVAKPVCTIIENGKISSPRHAKVGEKITREIMWDCDPEFREPVCALVRQHGLPLWVFEKSDPVRATVLASWRVPNQLTYILAKADVLDRICATQNELLYRLEMFRELCIDNQCWENPHPWFSEHSRFRYYWSDETYPVEIFDDTVFEVVILSGIAGTGKDTFYQKHYAHLPLVSLDNIRKELRIKPDDRDGQGKVAQTAYERAKNYCRQKQSFVWNSTNLTSDLRARLVRTLQVYNPRFTIIYLETTQKNIFLRRKADIKTTVLERMIGQLDMPLTGEAHSLIRIKSGA